MTRLALIRRAVPFAVLPLAIVATGVAVSPWLRAYPADVLAVPLFGAALLGVLVPVITVGIGVRRLWQTALIDVVMYVFFTMLVALHEPSGFSDLYDGIAHGPAQILSYALPLVTPRTLLVAPVTLCWIAGAVVGECVARAWHSLLPYVTLLSAFGLAYAGSVRGITDSTDGRRYDTLLAAGLLLVLLLMRAAQAWIEQDLDADTAQPEGVLPLRGLAIAAVVSVVVVALAGAAVQSSAFSGPPTTPARTPPLDRGNPQSPVSFVAGLRPDNPTKAGRTLFTVSLDRRATPYIGIADVDFYDGDGWSFDRTFRPSGGVLPAETDPGMRAPGPAVTQQYRIASGALVGTSWLPFIYRPERISGTSVDIDTASGMVVPAGQLRAGSMYTVRSSATTGDISTLPSSATIATSTPPSYLSLPAVVGQSLGTVVTSLADETHTSTGDRLAFLRALTLDLRTNYTLSGGPAGSATAPKTSAPSTSTSASPRSGGTGFANVLASILGPNRAASPEQYATLVALVARQIGVPSRVVTGFRLSRATSVAAGTHQVTTSQAWTWVEVPVQGRGWVVLDPSPSTYGAQRAQPSASARPSPSPTPTVTPNGLVTQSNNGNAVAPKSSTGAHHRITSSSLTVLVSAIAVGAFVLVLLLLLLRKWLRVRRRQRSGDPRKRLVGAWLESLDMLVESGLADLSTLTSAEIATRTGEQFGDEPAAQARQLGQSANAAIFSPTSWVGADEADAAWRAQAMLRRSVRRRLSWPQRVSSQLRYHRPPRLRQRRGPASWDSANRPSTARTTRRHRAH